MTKGIKLSSVTGGQLDMREPIERYFGTCSEVLQRISHYEDATQLAILEACKIAVERLADEKEELLTIEDCEATS